MNVLLVEANPADAQLIAHHLASPSIEGADPYRVTYAPHVSAACDLLEVGAFELVILNQLLPDTTCPDALRRLRHFDPGVPVVVFATNDDEALALASLRAGAQDYVLKPLPDAVVLRRILQYAVARQHLIQERDKTMLVSRTVAERWKVLAEASKLLAIDNTHGATLVDVARLVTTHLAEAFALYVNNDSEISCVVECASGANRDGMRDRVCEVMRGPQARELATALEMSNGFAAGEEDSRVQPLLGALNVRSCSIAPIRGDSSGLLVLGSSELRADPADLDFTRSLADRISVALQTARHFHAAQRAVAARDRAFSIVTHDLGSPLSTIRICATALLDPDPPSTSGVQQMAEIIQRSTDWMQQILQDLRDRSSLDRGKLAIVREAVPISEVARAAQLLFARRADEYGVEFIVSAPGSLPHVDADPARLLQVLSNLISNAMKFTPEGGRVTLAAELERPPGTGVRFTVTDTGIGIAPEELSHIFDWYWHTPRAPYSGTGLGLAIARDIVEAHGSRLTVDSTSGLGSTFSFTLPTATAQTASLLADVRGV